MRLFGGLAAEGYGGHWLWPMDGHGDDPPPQTLLVLLTGETEAPPPAERPGGRRPMGVAGLSAQVPPLPLSPSAFIWTWNFPGGAMTPGPRTFAFILCPLGCTQKGAHQERRAGGGE